MYNSSIIGLHDKLGEPSVNENIKKMEFILNSMQRMCKANVSLIIRLYLGIHTSEQKTCSPNPADLIAACTKWDSSRGKHIKNTVVGTAAVGGGDRSGAMEGGSLAGGDESAGSGSQGGYGSEK